jgi:hypothetical protein
MSNEQVEHNPPRSGEPLFRYIAEQYQALQQEPVIYQWKINYQSPTAWYSGLGAGIAGMLFGLYFSLADGGSNFFNSMSNILYCLGVIWIFYARYLINANKIYHYHLTAKGINYTLQDDIPEIAFTIMRGVGWFGCIACVLAAGLLGPAAFIGAGASALLAWKIKDMRPKIIEDVALFSTGHGVMKIFKEKECVTLFSKDVHGFINIYCLPGECDKVLKLIYPYMDTYEVHEVSSWREFSS